MLKIESIVYSNNPTNSSIRSFVSYTYKRHRYRLPLFHNCCPNFRKRYHSVLEVRKIVGKEKYIAIYS